MVSTIKGCQKVKANQHSLLIVGRIHTVHDVQYSAVSVECPREYADCIDEQSSATQACRWGLILVSTSRSITFETVVSFDIGR